MSVGLVIIKRGYRHGQQTEEWSNKYHLTGSDPADAAAWRTLFDAFVTEEKKLYTTQTQVIRGYGYTSDADNAAAVWSVDLTVAPNTPVNGTMALAGAQNTPSDSAFWVRWKLDRLNSKGKAIYLRKYFHDALIQSGVGAVSSDALLAAQGTAAAAFATLLSSGAGIATRKIRDTNGGNIVASGVSSYITTRTLKRRGKRP